MSIQVCCDFCGKVVEEYDLKDAWGLHKFREGERICCEDCEKEWEKYEEELRGIEQASANELAEKKRILQEKHLKLQEDSGDSFRHKPKKETTKKEASPTVFKTLRD